jgi:hypothetical protein
MHESENSIIALMKDGDYRIAVNGDRVQIERGSLDIETQAFEVYQSSEGSMKAFPVWDEKHQRWNHAIIERMCHNFYVVFVQRTTPIKNASPEPQSGLAQQNPARD